MQRFISLLFNSHCYSKKGLCGLTLISTRTPGVTGHPWQVAVRVGYVTVRHTCKQGSPMHGLSTAVIADIQESESNYRGSNFCQPV